MTAIADIASKASAKPAIRVALVEDKKEIRESWKQILNTFPEFACACVCETGEEALKIIPDVRPDVVLMDIRLPRMSGIECTWHLKEILPTALIVILTVLDNDELIFRALEAGADGYLLKRSKPADLRDALLDVLNGGSPMSSAIARRVVHSFRRPSASKNDGMRLSVREIEVLEFLSKGFSNKEIADQIQLSVETVRSYLKNIYDKLHVRSRTEAVVRYRASRHPTFGQKRENAS
jgi:DNA-binding NarL/FixJ family response regulator